MKRILVLPALAVIATVEIYRRGYAAPLLYGLHGWAHALTPQLTPATEPDPIG